VWDSKNTRLRNWNTVVRTWIKSDHATEVRPKNDLCIFASWTWRVRHDMPSSRDVMIYRSFYATNHPVRSPGNECSPVPHAEIWCQKTRYLGLPSDKNRVILRSLVLSQYHAACVAQTDRQTDRRTRRLLSSLFTNNGSTIKSKKS